MPDKDIRISATWWDVLKFAFGAILGAIIGFYTFQLGVSKLRYCLDTLTTKVEAHEVRYIELDAKYNALDKEVEVVKNVNQEQHSAMIGLLKDIRRSQQNRGF